MDRRGAIISLRTLMERKGISAMIIPSNDPHFGEYIPDHYKCREWLSCFTGSAGTLVVTGQSAALWTDSRYFVQADKELAGTGILLMKLKIAGTPSIPEWIKSELPKGGTVAIDEDLFTYSEYKGYQSALDPLKVEMISDPFDEIWEGRPSLEFHSVECMPESVSGESVISKRERLCAALGVGTPFAYVVTALDEIAWLCNIRGCDVEYNPLVIAYAIVTTDKITLFGCVDMFPEQVKSYLRSQNVEIVGYSSFTDALKGMGDDVVKIFSSDQATVKNYMAAGPNILPDPTTGGTLNLMKAKKNSVELDGFRRACAEDAKAWKKLLEYLRVNIVEKDPQEYILNPLTEYDIAEKLIEFRRESEDYRGESFEPIVAYAANGALPHYTATKESCSVIRQRGFLLIDSGAQYTYGTTDTTRTIPMGPLTQEEMEDYTAVLKGMTDLSMARFPQGTRGAQLDILARGPLFSRGKKYLHGTGHGIGHYLCVHEGPQSIRMEENPVHLYPGMVLSNEPAVYVEGSHGIRIENTIVVSPWKVGDDGEYYEFETITQIPISTVPVVWSRLSEEEKQWLYSHGFIDQPPM
mgnify:FL=1